VKFHCYSKINARSYQRSGQSIRRKERIILAEITFCWKWLWHSNIR